MGLVLLGAELLLLTTRSVSHDDSATVPSRSAPRALGLSLMPQESLTAENPAVNRNVLRTIITLVNLLWFVQKLGLGKKHQGNT